MAIFRSGQSGLLLPGTPRPDDLHNIVVPDGLMRYWPLDVDTLKSSTVQADYMGVADATVTGSAVIGSGQIGTGYTFSGGYLETSVNAGLTRTTPFSISVWANWDAGAASTGSNMLVTTAIDSGAFDGIWLTFSNGTGSANAKTKMIIEDTVAGIAVVANTAKSANLFYHLVGTYDGSSSVTGMVIYENGEFAPTTPTGTTISGTVTDRPWRIGDDRNPADSTFSGIIDDVRVYNRVLSPAEVRQIYISGLQGSRDQAALGIELGGWPDDMAMFLNAPFLVFQGQTLAIPLQTSVSVTLGVHS